MEIEENKFITTKKQIFNLKCLNVMNENVNLLIINIFIGLNTIYLRNF